MRKLLMTAAALGSLLAAAGVGAQAAPTGTAMPGVSAHAAATKVDYYWHHRHWHHRHWEHNRWRYYD